MWIQIIRKSNQILVSYYAFDKNKLWIVDDGIWQNNSNSHIKLVSVGLVIPHEIEYFTQ